MSLIREKRSGVAPCELDARITAGRLTSRAEIDGLVLLSGSVRSDRFHRGIGRSALDLPIDENQTLLDVWARQTRELAAFLDRPALSVRVMLDSLSPRPQSRPCTGLVTFTFEQDPREYRGTGGLLHDLAELYHDDDDQILVANGAQYIAGSLVEHVQRLAGAGGDVAIVGHQDGTPGGLMLLRCAVLRMISGDGFVDMKEQALPLIARKFDVRVVHCAEPTGYPVRTVPDYLAALRLHHRRKERAAAIRDPFSEDLKPAFRLVEASAQVAEGALLHDAVVLRGATVERGAVVVRSVLGPRAHVRRGEPVVDRLVAGAKSRNGRSEAE
jgi:hypothetical protein